MSLVSQISSLATRIATEVKAVRSELASGLAGKASTSHTHAISDVTNLQTTLDGKASTSSLDAKANLSGATFTGNVSAPAVTWTGATSADVITNRIGSGTYESSTATAAEGWPVASSGGWWHLLTSTHSNASNYYSMQFAADFFNSNNLYYRSTNGSGTTAWNRVHHDGNANVIQDKSANYTVVATDAYTTIRSTGSAITVTIPNVLAVGQRIDFIQDGAGQITFAGSGITLQSADAKTKTAKQYAAATVICVASGQYRLIGNLG
jgi:hypothetical protein